MNRNNWSSSNADNNQPISGYNFKTSSHSQDKLKSLRAQQKHQKKISFSEIKTEVKSNFTTNSYSNHNLFESTPSPPLNIKKNTRRCDSKTPHRK